LRNLCELYVYSVVLNIREDPLPQFLDMYDFSCDKLVVYAYRYCTSAIVL
jgi:hypothetical protein